MPHVNLYVLLAMMLNSIFSEQQVAGPLRGESLNDRQTRMTEFGIFLLGQNMLILPTHLNYRLAEKSLREGAHGACT